MAGTGRPRPARPTCLYDVQSGWKHCPPSLPRPIRPVR
ncbi:hypothetical protein [Azospirillum largimobile]